MAELKDFMKGSASSLSDFVSEVATNPMWSRPSAQNFAAHASLMSDNPLETYDQVMSEVELMGNSPTQNAYLDSLNYQSEEQLSRAMAGILSTEPEDQVQPYVEGYTHMPPQGQHEALEREAIIAPMANETEQSESFRIDTGERLRTINERRAIMQSMLNEELAKTNTGVMSIVSDMAEMIVPVVPNIPRGEVLQELRGEEWGDYAEVFLAGGQSGRELANILKGMPESERLEFAQKIIDVINTQEGVVLFNENSLERANLLRMALEEGYYTDSDQYIDNVISVLDSSGVGAVLGRALGLGKAVKAGYNTIKHVVKRDAVKSPVAPHSASQALKDTNPDKARALHEAMVDDTSGEVAAAAYGASRIDAIGHDIAGEVLQPFDIVKNKIDIPVQAPRINKPNPRVMDVASANGTVYLTEAERLGVTAKVVNDFRNATGIQPRTAMTREGTVIDGVTGEFSNNTVTIRAVYGTVDGGFTRGADFVADATGQTRPFNAVDDAIERTKIALRQFGIVEDDISILVRDGEHFNPVPASLASRDLDNFLVQVNFPYRVPADDIPLEQFNVNWNLFDRWSTFTGSRQGSVQRHLLSPSSMLQSELSLGAMRGVDKGSLVAKEMLDLSSKFTDLYEKLPVPRQAALWEELKRANFEGRVPDRTRLLAQGFEPEELVALDKFKDFWDTAWYLENRDKKASLTNNGYQLVTNPNGTKLIAKPLNQNQVAGGSRVYDPDTDTVITLTKQETDELYQNGGHFSRLENEVDFGGEVVGGDVGIPILVRNQAEGTISRGLRDWDEVLEYREGYFAVRYDAPYFIVREMRKPDGATYERAVAASGDYKSAAARASQLASDGSSYRVRANVKGEELEKFHDSVNLSGGRSAQRVRGERLEDATDINSSGFDMQYVMNPVDSMVGTARGMADRVAMREFMEVSKARFLQQYDHLLPKNKFGQTLWPSRIEQIGRQGELATKELADARTTWEAINYWENGYINAIDDGWKAALRSMGQIAGLHGATRAEKLALFGASQIGPTTLARRAAFNLMLVTNPIRQVIVQGHQAVQLAALRPVYAAKQLPRDFQALTYARLSNGTDTIPKSFLKLVGRTREEVEDMYKAYMDSGLSASIDRQSLVRGSLLSAADDLAYRSQAKGLLSKANRGVGQTLNFTRRIGFDLGEEINMMTSFLTFYDRALEGRKGAKLTIEELDDVAARARDFTYGMNFADDMPYNQNWLSMVFQFAQVPHKAMLQQTFNRNLTVAEKVRMASFNAVMYGVPPGSLLYSQIEPLADKLPEDIKEVAIFGLESAALNAMLSAMADEEVKLHYGALQAVDSAQLVELVTNIMTMKPMETLENTPAGSLMFGANPRLREWGRTVMKFTNFIEEDFEDPTTLPDVIKSTLSLSSGFSNAFKARVAYNAGYKQNAYGRVTKEGVPLPVAIGTALGFETQEEMRNRYVSMEVYEKSKEFEGDVKEQYRLTKMQMHRVGKDITDMNDALQAVNFGWLAFEGSDRAKEIWEQQMRADMRNGDFTIWNRLLDFKSGGVMSPEQVRHFARTLPDGETKDGYMRLLDDMDRLGNED